MDPVNPLYDPKTDNQPIADEVQQAINKPLGLMGDFSAEDKAFLDMLMKLIEEKKINLYAPSSLLNQEVYATLNPESQAKADQNCVTMLGHIRQIHDLMQVSKEPTYQVKNLVATLRQNKERLEATGGNLFII